ncbi:choice-of-anchor I family protein [Flexithrix dorotheae]|uniref:choice-of-anchor I family protein n=1 Tax=Flexithrix dorotheae TaxID=70993 RepID=UPI001B7FB55A|nr:choice-of-anchor I family protein [Flexithrix dorotheae]
MLLLFSTVAANAQELNLLGTYQTGIFDDGGAEIPAYDPATKRLFVTNGGTGMIDMLDLSDPANPTLISSFDVEDAVPDGGITSIATKNGLVGVTVELGTENGKVVFFSASNTDSVVAIVEVGALPDMLIFMEDGTKVLVANEGEPADDGSVDPEGSVSIISTATFEVVTADFKEFNGQEEALRARGVRIFKGNMTANDVEPEGISISPEGSTAFITLQENNAFGVLEIASATIKDILPMGYKDHSKAQPKLDVYEFNEPPLDAERNILFGGLSGLFFEGMTEDGKYAFVTVPDRGPNGDPVEVGDLANLKKPVTVRPFLIPEYQAQVIKFTLDKSGNIEITEKIDLTRPDGVTPISGLPNIPGADEIPAQPIDGDDGDYMDAEGNYFKKLPYDKYGADLEGIVISPTDGSYWMVDEYRPAIYHFAPDGILIDRFVPEGTAALADSAAGTYGKETLPAELINRRPNRGFEAMALDTDKGILYAFIQTPLSNPDRSTGDQSGMIRVIGINPETGEAVAEYVYILEKPSFRLGNVDKMGDAVYDPSTGKFFTLERDSGNDPLNKKYIFEVDFRMATNILEMDIEGITGKTLEAHTPDEMVAAGIMPVNKMKVLNLPTLGYLPSDKPEGLALLPGGNLAVLNDNDFGLAGPELSTIGLGIIKFEGKNNALDASDKDDAINIQNWPIFGMYMPDGISSFSAGGNTYYVTANEGDGRDYDFFSEEIKVGDEDYVLDPVAFPNAAELKADEKLGRLVSTTENGDIDGDGDYDQIFAFGSRSFSIWDAYGNQVYDSGDDFEQIIKMENPDFFNASNDDNEFDNRSDNKGPEPEGIAIGEINGKTYAFIGLERVGGIMVYDISDPENVAFVSYTNNRDFSADAETPEAGDLAPEGLEFISAENSPTGAPLLVVANEVSGTTSIYGIGEAPAKPTLWELVKADSNFSILEEAVIKVGLEDALNEDILTVFTPVNSAFEALFEALDVEGIEDISLDDLTPILLYHVVPGITMSGDLEDGQEIQTLETSNVKISIMDGIVKVNEAKIDPADVMALNGVAHVIDMVLIPESEPEFGITSFTLVNSMTNEDIGEVKDGDTIDLYEIGTMKINFRANAIPETTGSVKIETGSYTRLENVFPYAAFGDTNGDYEDWMPKIGTYTMTATPYTEAAGKGDMGTPLSITFEIIQSKAPSIFTLVNSDSNEDIKKLMDGEVISLDEIGTSNVNIRADFENVKEVMFGLNTNPKHRVEIVKPYALFGDKNGDYYVWTPSAGDYKISATPVMKDGAMGETRSIMVTFESGASSKIAVNPTVGSLGDISIYPNPVTDQLNIAIANKEKTSVKYSIFSLEGRVLFQDAKSEIVGNTVISIPFGKMNLDKGLYILKVNSGYNDLKTFRFLLK